MYDQLFARYCDIVTSFFKKLLMPSSLDVLDIDCKMLNIAAPFIYLSFTHTLNLTVVSGKLPSDFKIARVTPIYKGKGPVNDHGNYRPISVVATITKLLEPAIKKQLMDFLTVNNIISNSQFAYMKNMSTQFALHVLVDDFLHTINDKQCYSSKILGVELFCNINWKEHINFIAQKILKKNWDS